MDSLSGVLMGLCSHCERALGDELFFTVYKTMRAVCWSVMVSLCVRFFFLLCLLLDVCPISNSPSFPSLCAILLHLHSYFIFHFRLQAQQASDDGSDRAMSELHSLLGAEKTPVLRYVQQLMYCEDLFYGAQ